MKENQVHKEDILLLIFIYLNITCCFDDIISFRHNQKNNSPVCLPILCHTALDKILKGKEDNYGEKC